MLPLTEGKWFLLSAAFLLAKKNVFGWNTWWHMNKYQLLKINFLKVFTHLFQKLNFSIQMGCSPHTGKLKIFTQMGMRDRKSKASPPYGLSLTWFPQALPGTVGIAEPMPYNESGTMCMKPGISPPRHILEYA